jgi:hypothetical protein
MCAAWGGYGDSFQEHVHYFARNEQFHELKSSVFWVVTLCSLLKINKNFRGTALLVVLSY